MVGVDGLAELWQLSYQVKTLLAREIVHKELRQKDGLRQAMKKKLSQIDEKDHLRCRQRRTNKQTERTSWSPGLVVMGGDSCLKVVGSNPSIFFTLICSKNCNVCLKKPKNKLKRGREWSIKTNKEKQMNSGTK